MRSSPKSVMADSGSLQVLLENRAQVAAVQYSRITHTLPATARTTVQTCARACVCVCVSRARARVSRKPSAPRLA